MKRILVAAIAALTLTGCNIPDVDVAAYKPRSSVDASAAPAPNQPPKSKYEADQPSENTGDYSNYF